MLGWMKYTKVRHVRIFGARRIIWLDHTGRMSQKVVTGKVTVWEIIGWEIGQEKEERKAMMDSRD